MDDKIDIRLWESEWEAKRAFGLRTTPPASSTS
jgi:hypothetical protein